ncbi:NF-kappa-B inhibitor-like protein 1 [Babylonia areolata]|uniref:NF-kappa-B inhibitor-like protein 1 n=1 Tax=Babylonia areolata TaxID=304850 RepID=UPI003FD3035E
MPKKTKDKIVIKLINYIKEDRPRKFRECVKKYEVDLKNTQLSKRRTFLHCAAKHGQGHFISYLLKHGVSASHVDSKGDLAVHAAIDRALHLPSVEAAEVYRNVVIPLLKEFPDAVQFCDRRGADLCSLLTILNRHIQTGDTSSETDSDSSDSEASDSESPGPFMQEDDWSERLAREFADESADFYGRYDHNDDYEQERRKETFRDWSERMGREMHRHHHHFHHNQNSSHPSGSQKRKRPPPTFTTPTTDHPGAGPKVPRGSSSGIDTKAAIHNARAAHALDKQRQSYEARFQAALADKSERPLSYGDIPWPGKGSVEHAMEVLFGDKDHWATADLRKFTREQQVRWHPDKFLQKFVGRIAPRSFERVMERVKELSQALNKKAESLSAS